MARKKKAAAKKSAKSEASKRSYMSQADVPSSSLEQALRIPRAIAENYAGGPVTPLQLASALNMAPTSGPFRSLCGASIAYGLTEGGYNAQEIKLTPLGKRVVKPLEEGDDIVAKREAVLKPRVTGEFLNKYNGSPLPRHDIAMNVLEEMNVPSDKTESVYTLILDSAEAVGLLRDIKNKQYVDLTGVDQSENTENEGEEVDTQDTDESDNEIETTQTSTTHKSTAPAGAMLQMK